MTIKKTLFQQAIQDAIINVLENHGGELPEKEVCKLIGITPSDIPWGYSIGWARCLQLNQEMNLILSRRVDYSLPNNQVSSIAPKRL